MALTPEQRRNAQIILQVGKRMGASKKALKAALETGLTESNLRNLSYGDRDSVGVFQQRASQGWKGLTNVSKAAKEFYAQAIPNAQKYGTAGQLAQSVQRSAFPGRYDQRSAQANALLRGTQASAPKVGYAAATPTSVGSDAKTQIALSLLGMGNLGGSYGGGDSLTNSLLAAAQQGAAKPQGGSYGGIAPKGSLQGIVKRANVIDKEHLPYKWGGGHGPTPAKPGVPLDCSGAVSRVLGVNPRVSGEFAKWGKPGKGRGLTVYANAHHVLMEVNGKFWGTSGTNPGGGAGWIPRASITPAYLKNFVARHEPRLG